MIANLDGQAIREKLPYFIVDGKHFYIPFLDYRLNHYYTYEMAIFDTKQYFDSIVISRNTPDVSIYGLTRHIVSVGGYLSLALTSSTTISFAPNMKAITLC